MENKLSKEDVIQLVKRNNTAFWCCVVTLALTNLLPMIFTQPATEMSGGTLFIMSLLSYGPVILWQVEYCKLAFGSKNALAIICWFIQVILCIPAVVCFSLNANQPIAILIQVVDGIAALTLVISIYSFFKKQGLPASFITYISQKSCDNYLNSNS